MPVDNTIYDRLSHNDQPDSTQPPADDQDRPGLEGDAMGRARGRRMRMRDGRDTSGLYAGYPVKS
jgi:hypothetical protein